MIWIWGSLAALALIAIALYNQLARYGQEIDNAFSQIDVQLKRRHDLIPSLLETVKGVMNFEKETYTQVAAARQAAMQAGSQAERVDRENDLSRSLGRMMAVWENYPALKAGEGAAQLQAELASTENKIAYARSYFNQVTANYNVLTRTFPSGLVASACGFQSRPYFQVPESDREPVTVSFSGGPNDKSAGR